jgi:hypothetical protein
MLVSKIKPCMSKYKQLPICETANELIKSVIVYLIVIIATTRITVVILELIHAKTTNLHG